MGPLLGDEVLVANPRGLAFKPRNQWHTFWNAADAPVPGFARSSLLPALSDFSRNSSTSGASARHPRRFSADFFVRHGLEMDLPSVPRLVERFGLRFPGDFPA